MLAKLDDERAALTTLTSKQNLFRAFENGDAHLINSFTT